MALVDEDGDLICFGVKIFNTITTVGHLLPETRLRLEKPKVFAQNSTGKWELFAVRWLDLARDVALFDGSSLPGFVKLGIRKPRNGEEIRVVTYEHKAGDVDVQHYHVEEGYILSNGRHDAPTELRDCGGLVIAQSDGALLGIHHRAYT